MTFNEYDFGKDFFSKESDPLDGLKMNYADKTSFFDNKADPFASIRTNKTFEEISNEIALSTPFGKNSAFYKPNIDDCDILTKEAYYEGINYELLADDLKNKLRKTQPFIFDYTKYKIESSKIYQTTGEGIPISTSIKNNKPFSFGNKNDEIQEVSFEWGKLNHRKCFINGYTYGISIYFDKSNVYYELTFYYEDEKNVNIPKASAYQLPDFFAENPYDEYRAILLRTLNTETIIEFVKLVLGNQYANDLRNDIIRYYKDFFSKYNDDGNSLDALYEKIPDFVMEVIDDTQLWNHMVILSEKAIDTIGTNENLSVINLLKGVKNPNWWYNQINRNPEPVRKIIKNFTHSYIEDLVKIFSSMGNKVWTNEMLNNAWKFDLGYEQIDFSENAKLRYTGFAYYNEEKKRYKIGTAMFGYDEEPSMMPYIEKEIGPDELQLPFTPMKTFTEKGTFYIPCFVAEYFTDKKIDEEWWTVLNNIAIALLPEIDANAFRSLLRINSKLRYSKYIKVLGENPAFQKILVELSETRYMAKYLSLEEEAAVRLYTSGYYSGLNRALRGEIPMNEEYTVFTELLNKALKKLPKTEVSTFYRVEKMSPELLEETYKMGKVVEKKSFTSSSYDYMSIEEMMYDDVGYNVLIKITGKNGKNIEAASLLPAEREILFQSNTKFIVEDIKPIPNPTNPSKNITFIKLIEK